jgi:hypothetical protein
MTIQSPPALQILTAADLSGDLSPRIQERGKELASGPGQDDIGEYDAVMFSRLWRMASHMVTTIATLAYYLEKRQERGYFESRRVML